MMTPPSHPNPSGDPRLDPDFIRRNRALDTLHPADHFTLPRTLRHYDLGPNPYGDHEPMTIRTKAQSRYLIVGLVSGTPTILFRAKRWAKAKEIINHQFRRFPQRWCWLIDQKLGGIVGMVKANRTGGGWEFVVGVTEKGERADGVQVSRWVPGERAGEGSWVDMKEIRNA